jgi:hypothetical protein
MPPVTPVHLSPYRKGVCWFGVRAKETGGHQRWCGIPCGKYRINTNRRNLGSVAQGNRILVVEECWLCTKHAKAMQERGYQVTSVME